MAGQRSRITRQGIINGNPLVKELDEFTPPEIKKAMQETRGGAFIPGEIWVGLEKMNGKWKVKGANQELLSAYGLAAGELCQVDVKESHQDEDGNKFAIVYSLSGEITSITESASKMGELPDHQFEMAVSAYKKTEDGKVIYNIDRNAQILDLGNGDLMAEHRRNIGMP
ncbi:MULTISPECIES: phage major tail tube protein [unclassified Pseudoalteromonas]|jgi:P2 family phage contractile tail tube protein|uniref:phage major tail tube protein n=1 Tax=unclassified Pseudoalteromonas TaxID=194690 RepID=UPI001F2F447C|nr:MULTISPECIES: phage major tail tube protein [unclassified Pseudoalteromonas]MCF2827062.1 phage major tail tube protein [Pseudoalteromonas sp. OF5H-5]MCF2832024.1 phage major tail tube protein [Pseudoalteromonas sp. DL2-H6]MCF2925925.1 phage major tail tube protein [Pseudoalteromonas sp. DL2-H1]